MADPTPAEIRAPEGARLVEIVWDDGATTFHRHLVLRGYCPCAVCQGHDGPVRWVQSVDALDDAGLALTTLEPQGSYAVRLGFADGHATGIYTFEFLRELGPVFDVPEQALRTQTFSR